MTTRVFTKPPATVPLMLKAALPAIPLVGGLPGIKHAQGSTPSLVLERQAVTARRAAGASRGREASANVAALEVQLAVAQRELSRTQRLRQQAAATAQQIDRAEREARVIQEQSTVLHLPQPEHPQHQRLPRAPSPTRGTLRSMPRAR